MLVMACSCDWRKREYLAICTCYSPMSQKADSTLRETDQHNFLPQIHENSTFGM